MENWIRKEEKLPEEHQRILATIKLHGKTAVVPCWYIPDNRILLNDSPDSQTYSFSMVKAWQPFPEPYKD